MDGRIYEICRAAMFGQDSLSAWTDEDLENKQDFIDWALNVAEIMEQMKLDGYGEYTREEVAAFLSEVFDEELQEYRQEGQ